MGDQSNDSDTTLAYVVNLSTDGVGVKNPSKRYSKRAAPAQRPFLLAARAELASPSAEVEYYWDGLRSSLQNCKRSLVQNSNTRGTMFI